MRESVFADISGKSPEEIIEAADRLARRLAKVGGFELSTEIPTYSYRASVRAKLYWNMAAMVFEELTGTNLGDVLSEFSDGKER